MPPQTLALALGASIYPPAVAAVIALGRGTDVRPRVLAFVLAAATATYAVGALLLFILSDLDAAGAHHRTPSATVDVALGAALIVLAIYLRGRWRRPRPAKPAGETKVERYLQSRRLAFALGVILYVLPSPIYLAAVKGIADANLSTSGQLGALAVAVAVMLWLIELPMLMLLFVPDRATSTLEQINAWFARNGHQLVVFACLAAGAYLVTRGLVDLPG